MKTILLRVLRSAARGWWAHRALRSQGNIDEACRRERASILHSAKTLRIARACPDTFVQTGDGGAQVSYFNRTPGATVTVTLSHFAGLSCLIEARILIAMGKPFIDMRAVSNPTRLIRLPMPACGKPPDPEPWTSMSYVPLAEYCARAKALGAQIFNAP